MGKIIKFHIYNLYKFSYHWDFDSTYEKSKETFSSHIDNLIVIFIIYPLWIVFDFNKVIKDYISTNYYDIKLFFVLIIIILVILSYTKLNFIKRYIEKYYTKEFVKLIIEEFNNTPYFISIVYQIFFVFLNFFWVIAMFFIELLLFSYLKACL